MDWILHYIKTYLYFYLLTFTCPLVITGAKPLLVLHRQFKELVHETALSVLSFGEGSQVKLPLHLSTIMVPRDSSGKFPFV